MPATAVEAIHMRKQVADGERETFEVHWQEVADLVRPYADFTFRNTTQGRQKNQQIYDATATQASNDLAAALQAFLFNPVIRWFKFSLINRDFDRDVQVQQWLYEVTSRSLDFMASTDSGWPTAAHETALDIVVFGTGVMTTTRAKRTGALRFNSRSLSGVSMNEDDDGMMVDIFRFWPMRVYDIVERWPETVSKALKMQAKDESGRNEKLEVIHAIWRRSNNDPASLRSIDMPWGSMHYCSSTLEKLNESGFLKNPFLTPRWSKAPEETYGRSPAMDMLPFIKTVNVMARTNLIAGELQVAPPMNVPVNGYEGPIRTAPHSINYFKPGMVDLAQPLITGARSDVGENLIQPRQEEIKRAFMADRFRLPESDRMTATEVNARMFQALMNASAALSRLYAEWLEPATERVFDDMNRRGKFPEPPPQIAGQPLTVDFTSPFASSQRASESQSWNAFIQSATPLVQINPDVFENIDGDQQMRNLALQHNLDPKVIRPADEVQRRRRERARQEQEAQQVATAQGGAAALKDAGAGIKSLSEAPVAV